MKNKNIIGIVGGVGPYAGTDLVEKIFDNTKAKTDQEHLPVALLSFPKDISDRTSFLIGENKVNPADAIFKIISKLELIGASVVGIPCNTAHSPKIIDEIKKKLKKSKSKIKLIDMIVEVADYIQINHPNIKKIGLLSTIGTYKSKIYQNSLESKNIKILIPDKKIRVDLIDKAIYNKDYGIKSKSNPITSIAKNKIIKATDSLQKKGAKAIILGCTELPLAFKNSKKSDLILIDPTNILAKALIRETYPKKLKK
ncbi:aspartate/glutamate racemase family protein [archaeon]|jgi:aspartate racemase|nr:aspartate/glutamate racemase family protein [archaeon]MBT6698674.1 aspartate/glutamate racemase family protein [archaeon]